MIAAKMPPSTLGHDTSVTIQHEILTVGVAGRYVKKKYGQASNFRRIYAALFITSGFP
jgi:hypothetical protein